MNTFSKKHEIVFFVIALLLLTCGAVISLCTEQILQILPNFLETYVFHRTFNHDSYRDTMISLLQFPIFFAILFSTLIFIKFSDKGKSTILLFFTVLEIGTLTFIIYTKTFYLTCEDVSSEILFSKECFDQKTFWPRSWYYGMEFRFLYTQIFTAPFFFFTKNLQFIRAAQVVLSEILLYIATYFIVYELKIQKKWIKRLCCLLAISPLSVIFLNEVQEGCFYGPHIIFSFFYVGLFLRISYNKSNSNKKETILSVVFYVLSFLSGLTTIRYILNFTFPLAAILFFNRTKEFLNNKEKKISVRNFLLEDEAFKISFFGLLLSGIGYIFNSTILTAIYTFKNMNKVRFLPLSSIKLDDIKDMILSVIGYNGNVSFSTPAGIANIFLLIASIFTIMIFINLYKQNLKNYEKIFLQFIIFMAVFHLYTNICIEMNEKYLTMVVIFFMPFLGLALQNSEIIYMKKWILAASATLVILTNSFCCLGNLVTSDRNKDIKTMSEFLMKNGYEFGYAFSSFAHRIWLCSNGNIEVAEIENTEYNDAKTVPEKFEIHKWLQSKKFHDINYYKGNKHIFFAIYEQDYAASKNKSALLKGKLVYNKDNYMIFDYDSPATFVSAFD